MLRPNVIFLLALLGQCAAVLAAESKYPVRPVRLIAQSPAGGTADLVARVVGQRLSETLGQPFIVDNRAGAAGLVSAEITATAAPDGYTLLVVGPPPLTTAVTLREGKLPYNPEKDFAYVALIGRIPLAITVQPSFPAKTFKEFVALAKAKPGYINYGTAGTGSTNHITGELLKVEAGIDMTHVPFKGGAPAMAALMAGQLETYIATLPTVTAMVKAGRLRAIAVTTARRTTALPDVPTIAESGMPGFETSSWFCLLGPARMPKAIVTRLNDEVNAALKTPEYRNRLLEAGVEIDPMSPEQMTAFVLSEIKKMRRIVKASGAKVDS